MDNSNYFKRLFRTGNQLYVCFVYKGKNSIKFCVDNNVGDRIGNKV